MRFPSLIFALAASASAFAPSRFPLSRMVKSSSLSSTETDDDVYDMVVIGGGSGGVRASRIAFRSLDFVLCAFPLQCIL